jgi:hypothetical protein
MLCPANMLGYLCAIRRVGLGLSVVILSGVRARFWFSRVFCGRATAVEGPLFDFPASRCRFQERFFDCASRRFAQNQKRGTLRSE